MTLTKRMYRLSWALCSVVCLGCEETVRTPDAKPSQAAGKPTEAFQIQSVSANESTARSILDELRIQVFAYDFKAPFNHRASFWREVWRDGKLDPSLSDGFSIQPSREKPILGRVSYSLMDGQSFNSPKSRWSIRIETYQEERKPGSVPSVSGLSGGLRWVDDPLKREGIVSQSGQSFAINKPIERGKTYTLHVIGASRGEPITLTEGVEPAELAKEIPVAIFLRARIERVPTNQLTDGSTFGRTDIPPAPLKD